MKLEDIRNRNYSGLKTISFEEAMVLMGMPMITLQQGDKKFNFIVDSGANDNIIDVECLKELKYRKLDVGNTLTGLEGNKRDVNVCLISFMLPEKNKVYTYPYLIRDMHPAFEIMRKDYGVTLHGMVGSRFMNKFKYVLDFDELSIYSKEWYTSSQVETNYLRTMSTNA